VILGVVEFLCWEGRRLGWLAFDVRWACGTLAVYCELKALTVMAGC